MSSEEGPLSRWARRKTESRKARGGAAPIIEEAAKPAPPAEAPVTQSAEAVPPPDLPDIDSLTADSDFTAFLKEGVPQHLRRLALRKLWSSDPVLANLDGLIEYGEDYTDAAAVIEGVQSAWQVGRGYAREEPVADAGDAAEDATADAATGDDGPQVVAADTAEPAEDENSADEDDETTTG